MSAILGGTCRGCGENFRYSFGHPSWFEKWRKSKGKVKDEIFLKFEEAAKDQRCAECAPENYAAILGIPLE